MRLLIQPEDGVAPLVEAIGRARRRLELYVFRLDHEAIRSALRAAVRRGVTVRALVAYTNRGGEASLRKLEARLQRLGARVARTDDDLARYHGKMMIVDREALYVLGYNFTRRDIERSRSLGLVTTRRDLLKEAVRLFQADFARRPYRPRHDELVVSPANARAVLCALIDGARRQLLIYDDRLTDRPMIRLLRERARVGVEVKVIGHVQDKPSAIRVRKPRGRRLHVRAIVQDGRRAFVGSQSLRRLELDERREIGLVTVDPFVAARISRVFNSDWDRAGHRRLEPASGSQPVLRRR